MSRMAMLASMIPVRRFPVIKGITNLPGSSISRYNVLKPLYLVICYRECYKTLFRCGGKESLGMPVVERFTGFLAAERNASAETVRAYRREVECLQRFLREDGNGGDAKPVDWSKVTAADLRRFFSLQFDAPRGDTGEKIRPATAARKVSAVRTFLGFLVAHGEIDANPAVGI